ncbi:pyruvate kinase [Eubacterium multiforme]|uniref:Pyruvate kinase n=1 Tax=Eubacterium multiforme TaxID=83339 RepID=A0ABT9UP87_9FIRM|nr:pyruvate kinase [Eubacterium multiforme]MDQ0148461.1 pyruvate kinase [Eubacterium multiforme]
MRVIATLGPSINEKLVIQELISSGVNTFRFNFSHGRIEDFEEKYKLIKDINKDIHIMVDLPGSKIRISDKLPYIYKIYNGEELVFCGEDIYINEGYAVKRGKNRVIPLNIKNKFLKDKNIKSISMKDNTMNFEILSISNSGIKVRVKKGGIVRAEKGCNIKGFSRENLELSERDKIAISWGIKNKVDIICQSFVEDVFDIEKVKNFIKLKNIEESYIPDIWGKLETEKGIKNVNIISKSVNGIVIGRGDLVPECNIIDVPIYQDKIFNNLKKYNGEIIVATHILNSMKRGKRADLSEVDSIYNLILKGCSGFLLSGETSIGKAPIKTVKFLVTLIKRYK